MIEAIKIPEIGENVESGEVVGVLVKEGDRVAVDDVLIELETDKATVEIPSPVAGKIVEMLAREGDTKKVGDVIAKVDTEAGSGNKEKKEEAQKGAPPKEKAEEGEPSGKEAAAAEEEEKEDLEEQKGETLAREEKDEPERRGEEGHREVKEEDKDKKVPSADRKADGEEEGAYAGVPASPSVRRLARELGVDLRTVQGRAPGGRISESDVKSFVKQSREPGGAQAEANGLPDFSQWGEVESVELSKVRRLTAETTTSSWLRIPHVTQFDQADITSLEAFIAENAEAVQRQSGGKLTVTAILVKVCAEALKRFPRFNASIDTVGQRLILKKFAHIGVMVATARGLLVPVVRNADRKGISELAGEIADLADRARNKKIKADEMQGGTFSISNQGGIGGTAFTPIVLWPQAAILGVSRSSVVPVYRDGAVCPRLILPLSLSYDHRIVDGADAARFLRWICAGLEQPFAMFLD